MSAYTRQRVRLAIDLQNPNGVVSVIGASPFFWRSNDVGIELGFFLGNALADVSGWTTITLRIKPKANITADPVASAEVSVFNAGLTSDQWAAGTAQHAVIALSQTETAIAPADYHFVITALTSAIPATEVTLGVGLISIVEDGRNGTAADPVDPDLYFTRTASDARYAGTAALSAHTANTSNPHSVTKAQVGLSNADNTADSAKVVLSATKLATARTINGASFDGTADVENWTPSSDASIDLGKGTTAKKRFKDAHFSGKVNASSVCADVFLFDPDDASKLLVYTGTYFIFNGAELAVVSGSNSHHGRLIFGDLGTKYIDCDGADYYFGGGGNLYVNASKVVTEASINKTMMGLGSVDNTADAAKPVSGPQQTAIDLKADTADIHAKVPGFAYHDLTASGAINLAYPTTRLTASSSGAKTLTIPNGDTPGQLHILIIVGGNTAATWTLSGSNTDLDARIALSPAVNYAQLIWDGSLWKLASLKKNDGDDGVNWGNRTVTLGIPLYMQPPASGDRSNTAHPWIRVEAVGGPRISTVSILPGAASSTVAKWEYWTDALITAGIEVYWYVTSSYATAAIATVKAAIDAIFLYYPRITGVFFDETDGSPLAYYYYAEIHDYVTAKGKKIINNPGSAPVQRFYQTARAIMSFESFYDEAGYGSYVTHYPDVYIKTLNPWQAWHVIHTCDTVAKMQWCLAKAHAANVGIIFVTDENYFDAPGNQLYLDDLPTYFDDMVAELENYNHAQVTPLDIPGCLLHVSAEAVIKNGSDLVEQITDQAISANHLTQTVDANKPAWISSGVNGHPVLRFTGYQWLQNVSFTAQKNFSTVCVFKDNGSSIYARAFATHYNGLGNYIGSTGNPGMVNHGVYRDGSVHIGQNWCVVICTWCDYNLLTRMWVNGVLANTLTPHSSSYFLEYIAMGSSVDNSGGSCFTGDIYALDVFNNLLGYREAQLLTNYYSTILGL